VTDANGNPVAGVSVAFTASGNGSVTGSPATTDASGVATVTSWTLATTAGANTLTATAGALNVVFNATGTAGAPATAVKTAGDAQTTGADSVVTVAPSVRIEDANGNPVAGASVTFAVASGGGSVTGGTQTTDAAGIATVTSWKLGTTAGTNTLTATSGAATVTFTATSRAGLPATVARTAGDGQTATAGAAVSVAPSVTVTDQHGNPVVGLSVSFASSGNGSVTGSPATTSAAGVATVGSWTLPTVAGPDTLWATAGGITAIFTATGTPGAAATAEIVAGDAQTARADSVVAVAPSVRIEDANGNAVAGVSVTFAVASGGGSVAGGTQTTDAAGIATVTSWKLGTAVGTNTLTATSGAAAVTFTATATAGLPATVAKTAGDAQSGVAGSAVAIVPTVTVTDAYGNPVANVPVTFTATGNGSVAGSPATTDASGVATLTSWTLRTTAGPDTVTATVSGITATFTATATAGAPANLTKSGTDGVSLAAGSAVTPPPAVTVTDANNNPVAGATVTFAVISGGGAVTGATQTTDANGLATVGSWTIGTTPSADSLEATVAGLSARFGITGTVGPASAAGTQITATDTILSSGSITTVTVQATDAYGNLVTTGGASVSITSDLGTVGPVTDNGDGTYTADLTHAGTDGTATITGVLDGTAISDNAVVTFRAGGIQRTWTGLAGSAWTAVGSWSPRGLPGAADTLVIDSTLTQPQIEDADKTIGRLVMTGAAGTLNLGGFRLTVTGDVVATTGTVSNGVVALSGSHRIQGTLPALDISGGVAVDGAAKATGAVHVGSGSLTIANQPLTIAIP
jgi:adhesin/invasin